MSASEPSAAHARARHFVILLGWVSLFADLCYEGMRGAIGPYLALLGASATAVGAVAGTGEAIGYALRYASGALEVVRDQRPVGEPDRDERDADEVEPVARTKAFAGLAAVGARVGHVAWSRSRGSSHR